MFSIELNRFDRELEVAELVPGEFYIITEGTKFWPQYGVVLMQHPGRSGECILMLLGSATRIFAYADDDELAPLRFRSFQPLERFTLIQGTDTEWDEHVSG